MDTMFNSDELRDWLTAYWDTTRQGPPQLGGGPPLACSPDRDQRATTNHPYWEVFRLLPTMGDWPCMTPMLPERPDLIGVRFKLCDLFAHGLPSPADLSWMTRTLNDHGHAEVVEVGAGKGYWAGQLAQVGITVHPSDIDPPQPRGYARVHLADAAYAASRAGDKPLLMVWPPYDDSMAYKSLRAFSGDLLFYCGEGWGGCTADDRFFEELDNNWAEIDHSCGHATYTGLHDHLTLYQRKD